MGPIFILGFPRSGTTAMAQALSGLERFGTYKHEGHFIYLFSEAIDRIVRGDVNENSILREEGSGDRFLKGFARDVNRLFSRIRSADDTLWIDKTPDLAQVRAVPAINRLWPAARYIFLYRPVEAAVRSSLAVWQDRLTGREAETARRWCSCQESWRQSRLDLGRDRYIEIYQPDMLAKPQAVAGQLKPLLQLSDDEVERLTRVWTKNQMVNRPKGERGEAYDAVQLSPEALESVRRAAEDEVVHWPRLMAAADTTGE